MEEYPRGRNQLEKEKLAANQRCWSCRTGWKGGRQRGRKDERTNERKRSREAGRRTRPSWKRPALLTDSAQDPISICDLSRPPPIASQLINSWNPRHTPPHTSSPPATFHSQRRRRRLLVLLLHRHRRRSPASEMEASSSTALYPQRRCKNIYLVRHAQGIHNVEGEKDHSAYMSSALVDAHITPLGWSQVDCLREHVTKCGLAKKIELVVVSPLMRTMQTAVGVFGGGNCTDGVSASQLMVEGAGHSGRQAISSLNCPPFLAVEACRERLGVHPCDKRSSITKYSALFPAIDFSLIENDEDVLWEPDVREAIDTVAARGMKFLDWLWTREENEIAIVTHSSFLDFTLDMYGKECHPAIAKEMSKRFANCELRSMVLVDRSKLGSDTPTCDFPGKIPAGLDLPSDVADKKHIEEASNGNRGAHGCLEHSPMSSPPHFYLTT